MGGGVHIPTPIYGGRLSRRNGGGDGSFVGIAGAPIYYGGAFVAQESLKLFAASVLVKINSLERTGNHQTTAKGEVLFEAGGTVPQPGTLEDAVLAILPSAPGPIVRGGISVIEYLDAAASKPGTGEYDHLLLPRLGDYMEKIVSPDMPDNLVYNPGLKSRYWLYDARVGAKRYNQVNGTAVSSSFGALYNPTGGAVTYDINLTCPFTLVNTYDGVHRIELTKGGT